MSDNSYKSIVQTRVMRVNATVLGVVTGLLCGSALMMATLLLVLKGGRVVGPHLALLGQVFIGYHVTAAGSLVGFAYAGALGFLVAYYGAKLHNLIVTVRERCL